VGRTWSLSCRLFHIMSYKTRNTQFSLSLRRYCTSPPVQIWRSCSLTLLSLCLTAEARSQAELELRRKIRGLVHLITLLMPIPTLLDFWASSQLRTIFLFDLSITHSTRSKLSYSITSLTRMQTSCSLLNITFS
jgi:hypothetical protein